MKIYLAVLALGFLVSCAPAAHKADAVISVAVAYDTASGRVIEAEVLHVGAADQMKNCEAQSKQSIDSGALKDAPAGISIKIACVEATYLN
jgi:hypothetical protein